ncbi:MAG: hypothetical protein U1D30_11540 [Planctomycetota bacterium]
MPDPLRMLMASGGAALVSGTFVLISSLSFFHASPFRARTLWIVGIGVGFLVGCTLLGRGPRGSFAEDIGKPVVPLGNPRDHHRGNRRRPFPTATVGLLAPSASRRWLGRSPFVERYRLSGGLGWTWVTRWSTAAAFILTATQFSSYSDGACFVAFTLGLPEDFWKSCSRRLPLPRALPSCFYGIFVRWTTRLALAGGISALPFRFQRGPAENRPLGIVVVGLASVLMLGCFFGTLHPAAALLLFSAPVIGGMGAGLL